MSEPFNLAKLTLILGGANSGKSLFAEQLLSSCSSKVYLATAQPFDQEMTEKIYQHKQRRDQNWTTIEEPILLSQKLMMLNEEKAYSVILIDCITLWVSNLMIHKLKIDQEFVKFVDIVKNTKIPIVIVSNEVGMSIIPDNELARSFRAYVGQLNQYLAAAALRVYWVVAGIGTIIK
ncbi:MAG: bifunctional adenosylcobinamide kinase/adenosylcobinamide-phosphate guanylyltransferase [Alphaproteobacteria bacterium]|nr:bifunctional adenosylcobinamide kinase/adenosylcobinamide-phosphate guanylyltransferase [Alphaproteobacteria bacterium]